jgi:hypothetical protein
MPERDAEPTRVQMGECGDLHCRENCIPSRSGMQADPDGQVIGGGERRGRGGQTSVPPAVFGQPQLVEAETLDASSEGRQAIDGPESGKEGAETWSCGHPSDDLCAADTRGIWFALNAPTLEEAEHAPAPGRMGYLSECRLRARPVTGGERHEDLRSCERIAVGVRRSVNGQV